MRVLIATQYFPPEITAAATRVLAFAQGLIRRGHVVEVVCEVPNHPAGEVADGYGGRLVDRRMIDEIEVSYVWVRTTRSKAARARIMNYASYALTATLAGAVRGRPDVVLASSPPLPVGTVGAALGMRFRVPWVLDVRDIWPDAAVALGQLSEGRLLRLTERLERRLYRSAAAITTPTDPFRLKIEERGGAGKVTVVSNGTTEEFLAAGEEEPDRSLLPGRNDRFTWTYAGNLGLVAGLETAIEAARELGEGFRLILLGDGTRREELRRLAEPLPNGSVVFMDPVQPEHAARLMRASDALLASRAPKPELDAMVLSKLYDCCAVARPVIVSATGETSRVAESAEAAICIPPGDSSSLAGAVRRLESDAALRQGLGERGRRFAEQNTRERGAELMERVLAEVTGD